MVVDGSGVSPGGPELTWCYACNNLASTYVLCLLESALSLWSYRVWSWCWSQPRVDRARRAEINKRVA